MKPISLDLLSKSDAILVYSLITTGAGVSQLVNSHIATRKIDKLMRFNRAIDQLG